LFLLGPNTILNTIFSNTLSLCFSVTHSICLHFCFSVSRPGMRRIYFSSISFCL
jgi:hypothetical protein